MATKIAFKPFVSALGGLLSAVAIGPFAYAESRGELLYSTHCIACHTTQMHWRDKKVATDWESLKFQVQRWQDASSLRWSESDIQDVTRYLNESIYRYPQMSGGHAAAVQSARARSGSHPWSPLRQCGRI